MKRFFFVVFSLFLLSAPCLPVSAAICCSCTSTKAPTERICLNFSEAGITDCDILKSQSGNADVQALNCTNNLQEAECKPVADGGVCIHGPMTDTEYASEGEDILPKSVPVTPPTAGISIPNLEFSKGLTSEGGYILVPYIGQYISAAYTWLIGTAVIAAAIMVLYGGFRYIAGSTVGQVQTGKKIVADALIGLILILGTYTILTTVNTSLTNPAILKIQAISPDLAYQEENGTGVPLVSDQSFAQTEYTPPPTTAPQEPEEPVAQIPAPEQPTPPPAPAIVPASVSIKDIPFDRGAGAAENLYRYCTSPTKAQQAQTYKEKINLLVKVILGWKRVCTDNVMCMYSQAGGTDLPSGKLRAAPNVGWIVSKYGNNPSAVWSGSGVTTIGGRTYYSCAALWGQGEHVQVSQRSDCRDEAVAKFNTDFLQKWEKDKLATFDCGGFVWSAYRCAGFGKVIQYMPKEKVPGGSTAYLSARSIEGYTDQSEGILAGTMEGVLNGSMQPKSALQFGDLIYICCGGTRNPYSSHWLMYTGGREDVPFNFIEMGGIGGTPVSVKEGTLQDYIRTKTEGVMIGNWRSPGAYDPKKGLVFIWRPLAPGGGYDSE